jgi:hypothetical protein
MALEDAAVLSTMLNNSSKPLISNSEAEFKDLLQRFVRIRQPRVAFLKAKARKMRDVYALHDGEDQRARDQAMEDEMILLKNKVMDEGGKEAIAFADGSPNFLADVKFRDVLFGYDAVKEGCAALEAEAE